MNESEISLPLTVEEHEVLLSTINSYYDTLYENLPPNFADILPSDDDYVIRFKALNTLRHKVLNNWAARFD